MEKDSLVSVIVPVYHVEDYLDDCVRSIVAQSYSNLEIILVDDGSDDSCPQKCDSWAEKDRRIKVIHKTNGGLSDARNTGLDIAQGEYIAFVDSDDFVHKTYIELLLKIIEERECDIAICGFQKFLDGTQITEKLLKNDRKIMTPEECYKETDAFYDVAWNKLYKRSVIGDIRYPYRKLHEDIYTTYKIIFSASSIGVTNDELYYYRQRGNSIIGNQGGAPGMDIEEALWERYVFFIDKSPEVLSESAYAYVSVTHQLIKCDSCNEEVKKRIRERQSVIKKAILQYSSLPLMKKAKLLVKGIL